MDHYKHVYIPVLRKAASHAEKTFEQDHAHVFFSTNKDRILMISKQRCATIAQRERMCLLGYSKNYGSHILDLFKSAEIVNKGMYRSAESSLVDSMRFASAVKHTFRTQDKEVSLSQLAFSSVLFCATAQLAKSTRHCTP